MNINTAIIFPIFLPVVILSKQIIFSEIWLITQQKAVLKIKLQYIEKNNRKNIKKQSLM